MSIKNSYPELPEIPYQKTSIGMPYVVVFAKSLINKYSTDTLAMAYAIFRNESANGKSGVNNNYAGIQADVGRWDNLPGKPVATCVKVDGNKETRRFLCFDSSEGYRISFELLCIKVQQREMATVQDYFNKWVSNPSEETEEAKANFNSLLNAGGKVFA